MWFRLAARLGRTVASLQAEMSSDEFAHWVAFYRLEPFGYEVQNWRAALVAAATANTAGKKRNGQPFTPRDFMPRSVEASRAQTPEEMRAVLMAMTGGGKKGK